MLNAATRAVNLVGKRTLEDFEADDTAVLALARLLEVLGEAASHVSQEVRSANPKIPWGDMTGTRNRLIHAYFFTDVGVIWRIATEDLPPLVVALRALVPEER